MSRGTPFEPGNKFGRGRPKGSRNKAPSAAWRLLEENSVSLMLKNIAEGLKGDTKARLWCLDRLHQMSLRVRKLKLPSTETLDGIAKAQDVVVDAVANNKCTAAYGQTVMSLLNEKRKTIETQELVPRVEEIERQLKKRGES